LSGLGVRAFLCIMMLGLVTAISGCIMDDIDDLRDILTNHTSGPTAGLADLTLSDISIQPRNPRIGETVTLSVRVRNTGRKRSAQVLLSLMINGAKASSTQVPPLRGKEEEVITFPGALALPAGINVLELLVDPSNEIREGSEENNALATSVVVGEPDNRSFFKWSYDGLDWELEFRSPWRDLESLGNGRAIYSYKDYLEYVKPEDRTVKALASILKFYSQSAGFQSYDEVSFVLGFVQKMPYTSDEETKGDNYPRYPIETIVDGGGDCEDTSALFASIISNAETFNYGSALIVVDDHMAVGVSGEGNVPGTYFQRGNRRYYYCETTGEGYAIGELPDAYVDMEIKDLIEIS